MCVRGGEGDREDKRGKEEGHEASEQLYARQLTRIE